MRRTGVAGLALGLVVLCPVTGHADTDIVWPTYARVSYPADPTLTCEQLRKTIAHVTSDIDVLTTARDRVTEIIRGRFAFQTSVGTFGDRHFIRVTSSGDEDLYLKSREQIAGSRSTAFSRLDYLNGLLPTCKEAPPGRSPP